MGEQDGPSHGAGLCLRLIDGLARAAEGQPRFLIVPAMSNPLLAAGRADANARPADGEADDHKIMTVALRHGAGFGDVRAEPIRAK